MWVAFPSHPELWLEHLQPAREEVAALVCALAGPGGEHVNLLTATMEAHQAARELLGLSLCSVDVRLARFGDIWLRDTGPIFTSASTTEVFRFNGWGGKYHLPGDAQVARRLSRSAGARRTPHPFVVEGGALDHDGEGTALTTRQCLLNANRNQDWDEHIAERVLFGALGIIQTIWLQDGIANDHTDGHVDNLARFVSPGVIVCHAPFGRDDPNAEVYDSTAATLSSSRDAAGRRLRVVRIPSPGRIADDSGLPAPASHMNFVIANKVVIMPSYETVASRFAMEALQMVFDERQVIALPANALLTGGGSFHCISQQQPA